MVMHGGELFMSDLNALYQRVLVHSGRLRKLVRSTLRQPRWRQLEPLSRAQYRRS
jgi:hypothetical protein